jgi:hypothetical protein
VLRASTRPPSRDPFQRDPRLDDAWSKLDRALDLLEAEKRTFNDQKLVLREEQKRLQEKLAAQEAREADLIERELRLSVVPQAQPRASSQPRPSFTQQPFKAARAMLTGTLK